MKFSWFRASTVFLLVCLLSAFIAWCAGYNFNHRSDDVGFYVFISLCTAFGFAGMFGVGT